MTDAIEAGTRAVRDAWDAQGEVPFPLYDREADAIAKACIEAAIASGALVPASAVAEMRERCAETAENPGFIEAQDTEWDLGVNYAKKFVAKAIRQLDLAPACGDYVVVPKEPSDDVLKAGFEAMFDSKYDGSQAPLMYAVWTAMLNAASRTGGEK